MATPYRNDNIRNVATLPKCNSHMSARTRTRKQQRQQKLKPIQFDSRKEISLGYVIEMAGFLRTRKRSREDDLPCESSPLSKRINNLHLNYDDGNSSSSSNCSIPTQLNDNNYILPVITGGVAGCAAVGGAAEVIGGMYEYSPELNADQNPYYYEKNKMLYDLHVERVKRSNH